MLWIFAIGGVIQALEQWIKMKSKELLITVAIAGLIFGILEKIFKIYKRQNECLREVTLCRNGKQCHIKGFADTGNHLVDPISKKPVSIITLEAWHTLLEKGEIPLYRLIPYKAIGKIFKFQIFRFKQFSTGFIVPCNGSLNNLGEESKI